MKIIFINTVANSGSTGRIVTSLYQYLNDKQIDVCVAYGRGTCVSHIKSYKIGNSIDFAHHVCMNFFCGKSGFASTKNTLKLIDYLKREKPDIIHLHNIHGFYINCEVLFQYLKEAEAKVVWTLHDCWPFTGHCAYFDYAKCNRWQTGCHTCPQHRTAYPYSIFCDNSADSYKRKKEVFQGVRNLTIVTPSNWLADLVKDSFLSCYPVEVIHNGIDIHTFAKKRTEQNAELGEKKIVLGVANVWEKRKGLSFFESLATGLGDDYQIVLVGLNQLQQWRLSRKYSKEKLIPMKRTDSIEQLCDLYAKASVYVNPTLEDNYPTTNMEALACGTPVVTFNTGGSTESVDNDCGIVVEKGNLLKLTKAIETVCNQDTYSREKCLEKAQQFDARFVWEKYLLLYKRIFDQ